MADNNTDIDKESEGQRLAREFSQRTNKTLPVNAKGSFGIAPSSVGVLPKKDEPEVSEEDKDEVDWSKEIDLPQAEPKEEEQEWPTEIDIDRDTPQSFKNNNPVSNNEYYQPNTQDSWSDKKYKAQRELNKKQNELPEKKEDLALGSPIGGPRRVDPVNLRPEQFNNATFKPQANVAKDIAEGAEKNAAKGASATKSGNLKGAAAAAVGGVALQGLQAEVEEKIEQLAESRVIRGFFYEFYFPLFLSSILTLGLMLPVLNIFTFFHKKFSWFLKWGARIAEPVIKDALLATGVGAVATVSIDVIEAASGQDLGSIIGTIFKKAKMPIELKIFTILLDLAFAIIIGAIVFVALDYTCSGVLGKAGRLVNWTVETVTGDKTLYGGICKFYDDVMSGINSTSQFGGGGNGGDSSGGPVATLPGNGSCRIIADGACSEAYLTDFGNKNQCNWDAKAMSQICYRESGGRPVLSGTDRCDQQIDGENIAWSGGLFQINIFDSASGFPECQGLLKSTTVAGAPRGGAPGSSCAVPRVTVPGTSLTYCPKSTCGLAPGKTADDYRRCIAALKNPDRMLKNACDLAKRRGVCPWKASAARCGVSNGC